MFEIFRKKKLEALAKRALKELYTSDLGAETNTFFMVYNPSETTEGGWEVVEGE